MVVGLFRLVHMSVFLCFVYAFLCEIFFRVYFSSREEKLKTRYPSQCKFWCYKIIFIRTKKHTKNMHLDFYEKALLISVIQIL